MFITVSKLVFKQCKCTFGTPGVPVSPQLHFYKSTPPSRHFNRSLQHMMTAMFLHFFSLTACVYNMRLRGTQCMPLSNKPIVSAQHFMYRPILLAVVFCLFVPLLYLRIQKYTVHTWWNLGLQFIRQSSVEKDLTGRLCIKENMRLHLSQKIFKAPRHHPLLRSLSWCDSEA